MPLAKPSHVIPAAGTRVYVSATVPAVSDIAGYQLLNWTRVGAVMDAGEFGAQMAIGTTALLGANAIGKTPGLRDSGDMQLNLAMARDANDDGQTVLRAAIAAAVPRKHAIRIEFAGTGSAHNLNYYTTGYITSFRIRGGTPPNSVQATCALSIASPFIKADADDNPLQPTLELDFTAMARRINPRITFTRASAATYFDAQGVLRTAAAGEMRFDHDPATGEALGFLAEEQRTNLLPYSEDFANAAWSKLGVTVTPGAAMAPDGTMAASKLVSASTSGPERISPGSGALSVGQQYAFSVFAKAGETASLFLQGVKGSNTYPKVRFDLSAGTVTAEPTEYAASITHVGNGWYRCVAVFTADVVSATILEIGLSVVNDNTSGLYLWGAQAEAGAFATSYIPSAGAQATRAADNAKIDGAAFAEFYRQDEGTLLGDGSRHPGQDDFAGMVSLNAGVSSSEIYITNRPDRMEAYVRTPGGANADIVTDASSWPMGVRQIAAVAYADNDYAATTNGLTPVTDTDAAVPAADRLSFGSRPILGPFNGHIRRVAYYARRLTNAELQTITEL